MTLPEDHRESGRCLCLCLFRPNGFAQYCKISRDPACFRGGFKLFWLTGFIYGLYLFIHHCLGGEGGSISFRWFTPSRKETWMLWMLLARKLIIETLQCYHWASRRKNTRPNAREPEKEVPEAAWAGVCNRLDLLFRKPGTHKTYEGDSPMGKINITLSKTKIA